MVIVRQLLPDRAHNGFFNLIRLGEEFKREMRARSNKIYFVDYGSFEIISGCCAHHFPPHFHHSDCLVSLMAGRVDIIIESQKISLVSGESVFIPRWTTHSLRPAAETPYSYLTFSFRDALSLAGSNVEMAREGAAWPTAAASHHKLDDSGPQSGFFPSLAEAIGKGVDSFTHGVAESRRQPPPDGDSVSTFFHHRAAKFIADLQGSFELRALCDHCHVSKFHLIRQFKRCFGLTPHQYYDNLRIGKVRQGILTGHNLPDLAYALGFSDQSHMCHTFKKYMAVSPLQYKQAYYRQPVNRDRSDMPAAF